MLIYESPSQLLHEPDARRYLQTILLTAIRDQAERLEIRFGEESGSLYYRVQGRDWELIPPPEDLYPQLKSVVRSVSRLVSPERPSILLTAAVEGARFEPLEVGWLTYQIGPYWLDIVVRIDPREPYGFIQFDFDDVEEFSAMANEALNEYHASLAEGEYASSRDQALSPGPGSFSIPGSVEDNERGDG